MEEKMNLCKVARPLLRHFPEATLCQLLLQLDCSSRKESVSYSCGISDKSLDCDILQQSLLTSAYFGCIDLSLCM